MAYQIIQNAKVMQCDKTGDIALLIAGEVRPLSGGGGSSRSVVPYIGANGNWFVGTEDTGVKAQGPQGELGPAGFSPTVTENAGNSSTVYKLDIIDKNGAFTTPNLRAVSFVENAEVYSTEETVVGTWIDGKPIYRVVLTGVFPSTAGTLQIDSNAIYDAVVSQYGYFDKSYGITPLPWYYNMSENRGFISVYENRPAFVFAGEPVGAPFVCTFEYTKTTDTATIAMPSATALMDAYEDGVNGA